MQKPAIDIDVLIVGAGPVGLFLANECARRSLRWRLVETRPSQSVYSKALAIFPRTLEILDMAGLVGPFMEVANRVTSVVIAAHGRTLAHMRFAPEESPYPLIAMVPQDVTERLLVEQLERQGAAIEYETSFMSAVQGDDGVSVVLDRKGQRLELTAAFVVGCDSAHSTVRHLLKLPFEGAQYDTLFMLADVQTNESWPADQLQLCPSEFGPVAVFDERHSAVSWRPSRTHKVTPRRWHFAEILRQRVQRELSARCTGAVIFASITGRSDSCAGVSSSPATPRTFTVLRGQGMNTGLHDVWNLVWKLDLVLHGRGNDGLLESHSAERRPVIKHVIATTDFLTNALGTPNKLAQTLRDAVIPLVSRLAPFQHAFVQRLSELGVAYRGSPIVEGAGKRYFDDSLRGGDGIRSRFLLVCDDAADPSVREAAKQLAGSFHDVVELRIGPRRGVTLVRPDGYIAYSADSQDGIAVAKSVRSLLERQVNSGFGSPTTSSV